MASVANYNAGAHRPSNKNTARKKTKPVDKEIRRRVQQVFVQNLVLLGYEDFDVHGGKSRGKKNWMSACSSGLIPLIFIA